ncbi:MAG TPA: class I SAM-dependent methyltransferase [Ktedonobacterales bacterium]|nr:class I SAM-dependent methyltransferase [Ktedonobacterales bacterium]
MPQRFDTRKRQHLLSEEREAALKPEKLLRDLGLSEGMTIADIGCGPGFFTIPAAKIVGEHGHALAADIQGEMLSTVRSRALEHGLSNVRIVKTNDREIPIASGSCDYVLLAFTLHEIDHRASFLHRAARTLKPGGRMIVIEWDKAPGPIGPPLEDRITPEELAADAQAAGLRQMEERALASDQYLRVYEQHAQE